MMLYKMEGTITASAIRESQLTDNDPAIQTQNHMGMADIGAPLLIAGNNY
jgi:hypothetical protein